MSFKHKLHLVSYKQNEQDRYKTPPRNFNPSKNEIQRTPPSEKDKKEYNPKTGSPHIKNSKYISTDLKITFTYISSETKKEVFQGFKFFYQSSSKKNSLLIPGSIRQKTLVRQKNKIIIKKDLVPSKNRTPLQGKKMNNNEYAKKFNLDKHTKGLALQFLHLHAWIFTGKEGNYIDETVLGLTCANTTHRSLGEQPAKKLLRTGQTDEIDIQVKLFNYNQKLLKHHLVAEEMQYRLKFEYKSPNGKRFPFSFAIEFPLLKKLVNTNDNDKGIRRQIKLVLKDLLKYYKEIAQIGNNHIGKKRPREEKPNNKINSKKQKLSSSAKKIKKTINSYSMKTKQPKHI